MQIELSNGLNHVWQWDPKITITVVAPEDAQSVHFRWGGRAVEFPLDNHTVNIPPELMQQPRQIRIWAYKPDHTLDVADIPVYPKTKPADYAYTPTEIRTWEQLDERIKALEQGGGVAGVTSVNGKSGTVELTAKDVGATTVEDVIGAMETAVDRCQPKGDYITQDKLQSATNTALAQAKASGEFDGPQGPQGPQGEPGKDAVEDISLGLTSATVGQVPQISAVDDNGVPTAWEAADMPSGGSPPLLYDLTTSIEARWIDTGNTAFVCKNEIIIELTSVATTTNSKDFDGCASIHTEDTVAAAPWTNNFMRNIQYMLSSMYDRYTIIHGHKGDGGYWFAEVTLRTVVNDSQVQVYRMSHYSSVFDKAITGLIIGDASAQAGERVFGSGSRLRIWGR